MTTSPITILLATKNKGKIAELQQMVGSSFHVESAEDHGVQLPEETGTTFAENAELKSRAAWQQTGLVSIADDSGLEVDALHGAPGVYSARYAGENATDDENNQKLLESMAAIPDGERAARFRSCIAITLSDGETMLFSGSVEGAIGHDARGDGGFGYDPLFVHADGRTMAELPAEEKNRISHRGQAMSKAVPALIAALGEQEGLR